MFRVVALAAVVALIAVVPAAQATTVDGLVEQGWTEYNDCAYMHENRRQNWHDARAQCARDNAELSSVHSEAENNFLISLHPANADRHARWIGAIKDDNTLYTSWTDGSDFNYARFAPREPNGARVEMCLQQGLNIIRSANMWNDAKCTKRRRFYCKFCRSEETPAPYSPSSSTTTTTVAAVVVSSSTTTPAPTTTPSPAVGISNDDYTTANPQANLVVAGGSVSGIASSSSSGSGVLIAVGTVVGVVALLAVVVLVVVVSRRSKIAGAAAARRTLAAQAAGINNMEWDDESLDTDQPEI